MPELTPEIEQALADMDDADWRALTARVRPPAPGQAGKAEAERRAKQRSGTGDYNQAVISARARLNHQNPNLEGRAAATAFTATAEDRQRGYTAGGHTQ